MADNIKNVFCIVIFDGDTHENEIVRLNIEELIFEDAIRNDTIVPYLISCKDKLEEGVAYFADVIRITTNKTEVVKRFKIDDNDIIYL